VEQIVGVLKPAQVGVPVASILNIRSFPVAFEVSCPMGMPRWRRN
jgi:hypothetical protein